MATRCGAETPVLDWRERLVCSQCGSRQVDMVVIGMKRNQARRDNRLMRSLPA
jgi:hypothetical protein